MLVEKLDSMAGDIGRLGLVAAVATTVLMSASFTFDTFLSSQSPWSWSYLNSYLDFVISGITVLVVAVPEGLPLAVTIALAFSVKQMLAEKNLVTSLCIFTHSIISLPCFVLTLPSLSPSPPPQFSLLSRIPRVDGQQDGVPLAVVPLGFRFPPRPKVTFRILSRVLFACCPPPLLQVRQLDACETMGCATTILTDKTGTLTQNQMTAVALWIAGEALA